MYGAEEESIYKIVKEQEPKLQRPPRYLSKHSGRTAPTGSTFTVANTSRPGVSNLAGNTTDVPYGQHKYEGNRQHFGRAPASSMPQPKNFLKSKEHMKPVATLKEVTKANPESLKPQNLKERSKPPLPDKNDKPIMHLVTSKNFVVANAVENILQAPKKIPNNDQDFLNKEDFGKVPDYLSRIKKDIEAEYQYIRDLKEAELEAGSMAKRPLSQEERLALLAALKAKWEEINSEYQLGTHMTKLDTVGKIKRKEQHEAALSQIEKDIEKIKRENILIDSSC